LRVINFAGDEVFSPQQTLEFFRFVEKPFSTPLKRFGWYQARATLELQDGKTFFQSKVKKIGAP